MAGFSSRSLLIFATGVCSASDCDLVVLDEVNVLDVSKVETAAKQLENLGAVVRVRMYKSMNGAPSMDHFEERIEKSCPSWQSADGGTKNNLVVLIVAMDDRESGIYAGSEWERALGNSWNIVRTETMNPRLKDGDPTAAFVNSLREISKLIMNQRNTRTQLPGSAPSTVVVEEPTDFTGLWTVLGWALVAGVLILMLVYGIRLHQRRKKEEELRRTAQQRASDFKGQCSTIVLLFSESLPILHASVKDLVPKISRNSSEGFGTKLSKLERDISSAKTGYVVLADSVQNDPNDPSYTFTQYDLITSHYQGALIALKRAEDGLKELEAEVTKTRELLKSVPLTIAKAEEKITAASVAIEEVRDKGWKVGGVEAILSQARSSFDAAKAKLGEKDFSIAASHAQEAFTHAENAATRASAIPARFAELVSKVEPLKARIVKVRESVVNGSRLFSEISSGYAESSWTTIVGNGTEADNRLEWCSEAVSNTEAALSMEVQDLEAAEDLLSDSNSWLDEAESFMRSIVALKQHLEEAKKNAPLEIKAAEDDIAKARAYIQAHDDDIREELETDLAEASRVLGEARQELAKDLPDYLAVVKLAIQANNSADSILAGARSEHEEAERLRVKASTTLREAERSISAAKEYIEDHSSDVDMNVSSLLKDAKAALKSAKESTSVNDIISFAETADKKADKALAEAKEDVDDACSRRRRSSSPSPNWGTSSSIPSYRPSSSVPSYRHSSPSIRIGGGGGFGSSSRIGGGGGFGGSSRVGGGGKW